MAITLQQTQEPSEHIRERAKRMWTRTVGPGEFIVKPKEKGKVRRVVTFVRTKSGLRIHCRDKVTGESCPANAFKNHCSHIEAAITRLLINNKRESNRKHKQQDTGDKAT